MIRISRLILDELNTRALNALPNEICGLAVGSQSDDIRDVEGLIDLKNVDPNPRIAYFADPEELLSALLKVEASDSDVLAIFHSHPNGPAFPSVIDAERITWIDHSQIIIVPGKYPELSSWRWNKKYAVFEPEPVEVI